MGSGSSKKAYSSSSSSSSSCSNDGLGRKKEERKKRRRCQPLFRSPCFGSDHRMKKKETNCKSKHTLQIEEKPNGVLNSEDFTPIPESQSPSSQLSEENRETTSHVNPIPDSSSSSTINANNNNNNNKLKTRFKFTQGNVSLRLNRALSVGSSMSHNLFSTNNDHNNNNNNNNNNTNTTTINTDSEENTTQQDAISPTRNNDNINNLVEAERNAHRNRMRTQEIENNVRFSRTLSVGRLRDRVLRRTPFSDRILSDEMTGNNFNARRALRRAGSYSHNMRELISSGDNNGNNNNIGDYANENENNRELLERRSAFLERRRRIRSQVGALERLGSRRMTSEERSCVMSGRHRTASCTCLPTTNRTASDDHSSTSISRIVLLAEALFDVLDEIHQQSAALSSSRQSFPSIGSVPAPKETVESLPVKFYKKNPKNNEDISQCYICLVEYEEGDGMRVLPCNHEFHSTCVDKWLKEIHRVCPLCRGDVCRADASIVGK